MSQKTVVVSYLEAIVLFILWPLPDNQDFLFHSTTQVNQTLFVYIVNYLTSKSLITNASDQSLWIFRRHKLGYLIDITYNNCFFINTHFTLNITRSSSLLQHLSN